jgi:hypothetical protein
MIKPTIGRVVVVRNRQGAVGSQDEPALVTYVHSDNCINVGGFNADGAPFSLTSLYFEQGDGSPSQPHATWMPYQRAQAAKTESAEAELRKTIRESLAERAGE